MKKRSYMYFIAPVVALAVFIAIYLKYDAGYEARHDEMERKRVEEKQKKIEAENANKKKAVEEALAQQELRKKAKAEKEARDSAEKEARAEAVQKRDKAKMDAARI